jgi:uncharacterized OsmC-like protein
MQASDHLNGIDVAALRQVGTAVAVDPALGQAAFGVRTSWLGGTRSRAATLPLTLGSETFTRDFTIEADEPTQLLGRDQAVNPQELLLAALNACMTVGLVANAAVRGIALEKLEIETSGALDLRGFLALDPAVNPGYDTVKVTVHIRSNANAAEVEALFQHVLKTSPNFNNFAKPIEMQASLRHQGA